MAEGFTVAEALERQAASCTIVGSPLYGTLLNGLLRDYRRGGVTADVLDGVSDRPVHDALPLRLLATGHLLALTGRAPNLARHFPSCGGQWGDDAVLDSTLLDDFLDTIVARRDEFTQGVRRNVQTNEVGRAPSLASGFALIGERHRLPLDQLEIGSSAGLLSRWDRYAYDTGTSVGGDPQSPVRFGPEWWVNGSPDLDMIPPVHNRRASDIAPIDTSTDHGRATMLSFVWPDQLARIERLRAALDIARQVPMEVVRADAGDWLAAELADGPRAGTATVVFHSIVWQYLPRATRDGVRAALAAAGDRASADNPLCWMRLEPDTGEHAALRLTTWPGHSDEKLAIVGYHGADVTWLSPPSSATASRRQH